MKNLIVAICLIMSAVSSWATVFTDLKFGQYQIADSQWDVGACLYTSTCNIYSTNPGTMYNIPWTNGQWAWQAGQYVKFGTSGIQGYPYTANVYNANGSLAGTVGSGKIINMGVDANGYALFFFVGTDDNTGQLFSTNYGFTGNGGYNWTGTLNPTIQQVDSFANSYGSTTPLAGGQTYSPAPAGPTVTGGTITQTNAPGNQVITSGGSYVSPRTNSEQTRINNWANGIGGIASYNNTLYIEQISGNFNSVIISQTGTKNRIDMTLNGSGSNSIANTQVGNNYFMGNINGMNNQLTTNQTQTVGTNYAETVILGNNNIINHTQNNNNNRILFSTISGNNNTVTSTQSGGGQHELTIKLTGNGHTVLVDQGGAAGANKANIDLTNSGGPASVDLQQSGGKTFGIIQSCTNPAGCTTVIRQ